ncbi:hypothetical protein [Nitrospirillum iridis]|uniref:Uncharacterized protein n=1 Tax=Nitrospirillum iridis TaxID=765888 RepID=A0A7X0ECN9_9PROT|nr:hypothetical protein [Nitrospirillum iridis]MBB6249524.1 hypothetical protein [Nitrospirillum iridis]
MLDLYRNSLSSFLVSLDEIMEPLALPDKWIGLSVLQKAIRRGDTAKAAGAALALLPLDRSGLWRRLLTIAFEDVGIGDENAVAMCAAAVEHSAWRAEMGGDARVAVTLCKLLAEGVKDRSADHLICAARSHPAWEDAREAAGNRSLTDRLRMVEDASLPIGDRITAAWFASGVEWYPERRVGAGDLDGLMDAFESAGAAPGIVAATRIGIRRVGHPVVLVPAMLSAVTNGEPHRWEARSVPQETCVNGLPLHAYDQFTRLGKAAIARFVRQNNAVRTVLERFVPDRRWEAATGLGVFFAEGSQVAKRRLWCNAINPEHLGREADFESQGVDMSAADPAINVVGENLQDLNRIRTELLRH